MLKNYLVLTKTGIVVFVLVGAIAGYALGYEIEKPFSLVEFSTLLLGLYFLSAGTFSLNQAQEVEIDRRMKRTSTRPVVSGRISRRTAFLIGALWVALGLLILSLVNFLTMALGALTVVLYNLFYTYFWKKKWAFGAVPGAIPGAMPVVLGYAAVKNTIVSSECLYLFLIMFLWQMPHFWAIAMKCREDYKAGGVPVLPVVVGEHLTVFHIGLYVFVYVGVALASPWFVHAGWWHLILVIPVALMLLWVFYKYQKAREQYWLSFFMWVNLSLLVFLATPAIDKWSTFWTSVYYEPW